MTTDFKVPLTEETKAMLKRSAESDGRSMRKQCHLLVQEALAARAAEPKTNTRRPTDRPANG